MEWFIETRFGDPILSLSLSSTHLAYGSALGQIGLFSIPNKELVLLSDLSEESVKGIHITQQEHIYACIGDRYVLVFKKDEENQWHSEGITYETRIHTQALCNSTHILQSCCKVCLLTIEDNISLFADKLEPKNNFLMLDCATRQTEELKGLYLPKFSVPLCFNGTELLWMEKDCQGVRVLKLLSFNTLGTKVVKYLSKEFGTVSCVNLYQDRIVFVHNSKEIKVMNLDTGDVVEVIGKQRSEILNIFLFESSEPRRFENLMISVHKAAVVCVWHDGQCVEVFNLCQLEGIKVDACERFFGMGYPYYISANEGLIAVSTDLGIIVLKSEYLANLI